MPPLLPPGVLPASVRGAVTGCGVGVPCSVYPRFPVTMPSAAAVVVVVAEVAGLAFVAVAGLVDVPLLTFGLLPVFAGVAFVGVVVVDGLAEVVVVGREVVAFAGVLVVVLLVVGREVVAFAGVLVVALLVVGRVVVVVVAGLEVEDEVAGRVVVVVAGRETFCCAFW